MRCIASSPSHILTCNKADASKYYAVGIEGDADANGDYSVAMGYYATAAGDYSTGLGAECKKCI